MFVFYKPRWATVFCYSSSDGAKTGDSSRKVPSIYVPIWSTYSNSCSSCWLIFTHMCNWVAFHCHLQLLISRIIHTALQIQQENGWLRLEGNYWLREVNALCSEIRTVSPSVHHSLAYPARSEAGTKVLPFSICPESQSAPEAVCCRPLPSPLSWQGIQVM